MTQHDHQVESDTPINGEGSPPPRTDEVTREQNGQFSMESESIDGPTEDSIEAEQEARIENDDVNTINALQVTMDRSGAEYIHAQKVFLTNSGAKSIEGRSSKLTNSGALELRADKAHLHQSSAVIVTTDELQMESGSIIFSSSEKVTLQDGARVSVIQARDIQADGDIHAFMLLGNDVNAGGNIETTVDGTSAAIFGAVFGAVFALIWKVIRRG